MTEVVTWQNNDANVIIVSSLLLETLIKRYTETQLNLYDNVCIFMYQLYSFYAFQYMSNMFVEIKLDNASPSGDYSIAEIADLLHVDKEILIKKHLSENTQHVTQFLLKPRCAFLFLSSFLFSSFLSSSFFLLLSFFFSFSQRTRSTSRSFSSSLGVPICLIKCFDFNKI